jgi:hypothetical protein
LKAISAAITALGFALCATARIAGRCAAHPLTSKAVAKRAGRYLVRVIPGS